MLNYVTMAWKVYGREGHRQKLSFEPSMFYDFGDKDSVRAINVLSEDITHTNDYVVVMITRNTREECEDELEGQLSDGLFENCRYGKVELISAYELKDFKVRSLL